jgi:imidazolonepropionase-like amidohydrolase
MKLKILSLFAVLWSINGMTQESKGLIIKDINLITMTSPNITERKSVLIENGKIVKIDDFNKLSKKSNHEVIEGYNKFLMPGLAEMHSHVPAEKDVENYLLENIAAGVTRIRIMNTKTPQLLLKNKIETDTKIVSPKIHYSHIITREDKYTEPQFDSLMVAIKKNNLNFIKVFSIANEEVFDNLMKSANRNSIIVCGHYPKEVALEIVLQSGYKSIEHLAGYEKINDQSALANAILLTKKFSVYNCPTLDWDIMSVKLSYPNDYKNRLVYFNAPKTYLENWEKELNDYVTAKGNDQIIQAAEKYKPQFQYKQKILKKLNDNKCLLLLGSDPAGTFQMNGFNMHDEMVNWSNAGIDTFTILKSATSTPASFFGETKNWGTIEPGKSADLIILDKNPLQDITNIKTVAITIIEGKVYFKSELLKKLESNSKN